MKASVSSGSTKFIEREEEAVSVDDNNSISDPADSIVWALAKGDDGWTIYNEAIGYVGYVASGNSAGAEAEPSAKSSWTISVGETSSEIVNVADNTRKLQYNKGNPRFACYTTAQSPVNFYKESGEATFSVKLDPAKYFEVEVGAEATITATPKNASGEVTYEWAIGGTPVDAAGAVLTLDTSAATEEIEVTCTARDESGAEATAGVSYKVVAPAVKYAIECAIGIPNGSVSADKTEAEAGEEVTLTAKPDAGYKLEHFLVDGEPIEGNTFTMPEKEVLVSASFIEKPVVAGFAKITSLDELTEGEYVITGAKAAGEEYAMKASIAGTSTKYIERREVAVTIEDDTVTDADEEIIWTLAQGENGWTIYNEAVGYAGYVASGNSAGAEAEASDKSSWTIAESETEGLFLLTNVGNNGRYLLYNSGSPRFACYEKTTSGKQLALYKGSGAPATFSVKLDPAKYFEVEVGAEATITATPKNASGEVTYEWAIGGTPVDAAGAVLTLDTSAATEEIEVTCTARDESGAEATAGVSYKVVAPAVKYAIECAIGIPNGSVSADKTEAEAGEEVTLTAKPDAGYKLEHFLVDGEPIEGNTFTMPEKEVLVSASFIEKPVVAGFAKITSLDELTEGEYVITGAKAAGEEYAMKASIAGTSTKYIERREVAVTIEDDTVTDADEEIIWTLAQGENGWTIYNEAVGYAGYVASGNSAGAEAEASDKSSWTIAESETEGLFLLTNVGNNGRYLLYNSGTPRFACYEKTTSGKQLALYKKASGPQPGTPKLVCGGDETGVVNTTVNFTVTPEGFSTSVTPELASFEFPDDSNLTPGEIAYDFPNVSFTPDVAGVYTFNYSASAGEEYAEGSWSVTVTDPVPVTPVGITKMTFAEDGSSITLEFDRNATAIYGSKYMSVPPAEWGPVTGAAFGDKSATIPVQDGPLFLRAE